MTAGREAVGVTVSEAALGAALAKIPDQHISLGHWGPGVRRADMRKALEAAAPVILADAASQLKAACADEITAICAETVLEACAAERDRWRAVLADHYLMGINCGTETKRDNPVCGCSRIHLGWHDSVGAARQAWINHVAAVVGDETP